jgi:hypothetical protein
MGGGYLHELHASLDQRWRPEDVLRTILAGDPDALPETLTRRVTLRGGPPRWSSMSSDFTRPPGGRKILESVQRAFQRPVPEVDADDPMALRAIADNLGGPLHWTTGADPDGSAHLTRAQRKAAGIELSRRQYNRQWRTLRRLDRKAQRLDVEQTKRELIV